MLEAKTTQAEHLATHADFHCTLSVPLHVLTGDFSDLDYYLEKSFDYLRDSIRGQVYSSASALREEAQRG